MNKPSAGKGLVIVDRDGTVIVERHYLSHPDGVELLPNAIPGLRRLNGLGFSTAMVTNQSGVGRALFTADQLIQVNRRMTELLEAGGVRLDGIYSCPHVPEDACECRKPMPGLAVRAARDLGLRLRESFVIGDKPCDIQLGHNIGATTILVRTGYGRHYESEGFAASPEGPHAVVDDLHDAAILVGSIMGASRKGQLSIHE